MFGSTFYHGTTRKYVALFGSLFNDIVLERVDGANNEVQYVKVPISYGPKDRYLVRLKENPDLLRQVNQVLPRMSFEIKTIEYDSDRKLNTLTRNRSTSSANGALSSQYTPVPYNYNIELAVLTRNSDDALRIVEQILPFFTPEWTVPIKMMPEMGIEQDIPIVLKSVDTVDTYDEAFTNRYAIIWTLMFTLKGYVYGPVSTASIIKNINVNFEIPTTNTAAQGVGITPVSEYFTIIPGLTANGQPTSNASLSIPASQITANDNYGYITDYFSNL
jgi:hypothetical protein